MSEKKPLSLLILRILERYSDENHPLTHNDIGAFLEKEGCPCERKSIGRCLNTLRNLGYEIVTVGKKGSYLASRKLERGEILLLIDSILCSRHLNPTHTKDLVKKISSFGGAHFSSNLQSVDYDRAQKSGNYQFLFNVEELNTSISEGKKIRFYYNKYGSDFQLQPTKYAKHLVNPYRMLLHNQRYYLAGNVDKYETLTFFRVDKITDLEITEESAKPMPKEWQGSEWLEKLTALPYLYTDPMENVVLECEPSMTDELVDWFGHGFTVLNHDNNSFTVRLHTSPQAMLYWVLQYGSRVKIVAPESLKTAYLSELEKMRKLYE